MKTSTSPHSKGNSRRRGTTQNKVATAETHLETPAGRFELQRRPRRPNEVLQAWDAADRYLIETVLAEHAQSAYPADARLLVVNDTFGALACALSQFQVVSWSDSAVSRLATLENCSSNHCQAPEFLPMTAQPQGTFHRILYRLPRSRSLQHYQLLRIRHLCEHAEQFLGAAQAKYIDHSKLAVFSETLGPAEASLAWKKARLIRLSALSANIAPAHNVPDDRALCELPEFALSLINRANVFSRGKLDLGSRLLLSALPSLLAPEPERIADLGCGNGLLGLCAARQWPQAKLYFCDDSYLAIASAQENWQRNIAASIDQTKDAEFVSDDCLGSYQGEGFDLILCNPPFHQEQQIGDHIARQMFDQARQHLRKDGRLCVVGNRHLGYHLRLNKLFRQVDILASNSKFVVFLARL